MANGALHDFGGDVVGSPTHGAFLLVTELEFGGKPEVSNFEIHVVVEEDVAHLEVAVDDAVAVHVLEGGDDLVHVVAGLLDGELLALLDHLAEGLVGAEFEDDVDVLLVLEDGVELDDLLVVECFVDFYL